jgi:hypothetical protein
MPNPFLSLSWDLLKETHQNAMDALFLNMSLECQITYGSTKWTDCENCIYDPVGKKSSNRYQPGGPVPFTNGQCPYCAGLGRTPDDSTEAVDLVVLWNPKDWVNVSHNKIAVAEGKVQTISFLPTYAKLKQAKEIIVDVSLNNLNRHVYVRDGEPGWIGLGESRYVVTMWKEAGSGG